MVSKRKASIDAIFRGLAITRYDIEAHQSISDYSLNIHGENFFRDLFNDIFELNLINTNFTTPNTSCVDLYDSQRKVCIQITTTKTSEKIMSTLNALTQKKYKGCKIKIYYLLDKARPNKNTISKVKKDYQLDLKEILFDHTDLTKAINNLHESRLIEIHKNYFNEINEKYTDEITLNLTINHMIKTKGETTMNYDDSFGSIAVKKKLALNNINERISSSIKSGSDYNQQIDKMGDEDSTLRSLRQLVIDDIYFGILAKELRSKEEIEGPVKRNFQFLHDRAIQLGLDFNKIIFSTYSELINRVDVVDFNTSDIGWIIISYFFELCDIGAHKK